MYRRQLPGTRRDYYFDTVLARLHRSVTYKHVYLTYVYLVRVFLSRKWIFDDDEGRFSSVLWTGFAKRTSQMANVRAPPYRRDTSAKYSITAVHGIYDTYDTMLCIYGTRVSVGRKEDPDGEGATGCGRYFGARVRDEGWK